MQEQLPVLQDKEGYVLFYILLDNTSYWQTDILLPLPYVQTKGFICFGNSCFIQFHFYQSFNLDFRNVKRQEASACVPLFM